MMYRFKSELPSEKIFNERQRFRFNQCCLAMKEAGIYDNSIIIITSDHGGINKGHGGITMSEMETPFIIAGKGIQRGRKFQESMMQFDIAPTIADIFHLDQPQVWVGRSMKQVFIDDI